MTEMTKIRNKNGTLLLTLQIIKKYSKQLHANKWDNVDEMGRFLEKHKLSKETQE